jgi:hypothetical protein
MGYDIYLRIDTGGETPAVVHEVGNYTYNVSEMFHKALGFELMDLGGKICGECLPDLERATLHMSENPTEYIPLNPENGWGDYNGALGYLIALKHGCKKHPKAIISIS